MKQDIQGGGVWGWGGCYEGQEGVQAKSWLPDLGDYKVGPSTETVNVGPLVQMKSGERMAPKRNIEIVSSNLASRWAADWHHWSPGVVHIPCSPPRPQIPGSPLPPPATASLLTQGQKDHRQATCLIHCLSPPLPHK